MKYVINGAIQQIDEPLLRGDRHYVPLAQIVQAMGGSATWDNNSKTATVTLPGKTIAIQMANETVKLNGIDSKLSALPFVLDNTMYVPWDFFRSIGYQSELQDDLLTISS